MSQMNNYYYGQPTIQTTNLCDTQQQYQHASSGNGSPLASREGGVPATLMVHTPYSCEHDLVPSNSEVASQCFGSSWPKDNNNGAVQQQQQQPGSAMSRRSTTCSSAKSSPAPPMNPIVATADNYNYNSYSTANFEHTTSSCSDDPSELPDKHNNNVPYHHHSNNGSGSLNGSGHHLHPYGHPAQQRPRGNSHASSSHTSSNGGHSVVPANSNYHSSPAPQNNPHHSSGYYPNFSLRAPVLSAPVHSPYLNGKAEYLEMPSGGCGSSSLAEITTPAQWNRTHKVFIGHVKFEVTADGLRWVIYMLTGVQAGKIEVRGMGCFMCFFSSAEDVFRVRGLHKRVLFDTVGLWFAQNSDQEQTLHHYAANVAPGVHAKLPKGLMVVDEETSRRRSRKHKGAGHATDKNKQQAPAAADHQVATTAATAAVTSITVGGADFNQQSQLQLRPSAEQLWAAQSEFHHTPSGSRLNSAAEDEYCS